MVKRGSLEATRTPTRRVIDRSSKETWKCTVREPSLRSPIYQVGNGSRRRSRKIVEKCTVSSKLRIDAR